MTMGKFLKADQSEYYHYERDTFIMPYGHEDKPQKVLKNSKKGGYKALGTPTKEDSSKYQIIKKGG